MNTKAKSLVFIFSFFASIYAHSRAKMIITCDFQSLASRVGTINNYTGVSFMEYYVSGTSLDKAYAAYELKPRMEVAEGIAKFLEICPSEKYTYEDLKAKLISIDQMRAFKTTKVKKTSHGLITMHDKDAESVLREKIKALNFDL